MRKLVIKVFFLILLSVFAIITFYISFWCYAAWRQGYSWSQMDWNQNGATTISEYFASSDIGRREVINDGRECVEFFHYKDGSAVRVDCDDE